MDTIHINWLGQINYDSAWKLQKKLVAQRQQQPTLPDELLLLEHPPTYTLGRSGKLENLLLTNEQLAANAFTLRWVDRGGDITYHGPGQLVGYPILNLKQHFSQRGQNRPDLHQYLRDLEEVLIQTCAQFGIRGWRFPGYTGVWVEGKTGPEKIAAIGIKVSSGGISSHGFAINICPNLTHFEHIIPCGIKEHGVTSMATILERPLTTTDLIQPLTKSFCHVFNKQPYFKSEAQPEKI